MRYSVLRGEIISRTGLQIVRYFQKKVKFLHLLIYRKALKLLMVTSSLANQVRNAFGSKNGVAMTDLDTVKH